ncbi:MAG: hypothetical protein ABIP51_20550 [Bacteroidia bacterium]
MDSVNKFIKFLTSGVFVFFCCGCVLVVIGHSGFLNYLAPNFISKDSWINAVVKSIGAALIGSGVFTTIIKSTEYTEIFSDVIGKIIWSKKYIEKRSDKKDIWRMVSRLMYDEKFPLISNAIEDIITEQYFPVSHNFYIENYDFLLNMMDYNDFFWIQEEVVALTLKPINAQQKITYFFRTVIDKPKEVIDDFTAYTLDSITVNGTKYEPTDIKSSNDAEYLNHSFSIEMHNEDEYEIVVKRTKTVCKKSNPDKRVFASYIINDSKVTIMCKDGTNIDFHKMGTINEFKKSESHVNEGTKMVSWQYKGLILPQQGFIIIFK